VVRRKGRKKAGRRAKEKGCETNDNKFEEGEDPLGT
jgi:hypothetical protein